MTNSKTMKRALLTSVIALVVCFSMLVGTTFAWFTDSVTSSGNIIQSGTLEVAMSWAEGAKDPSATDTTWTNAEAGAIFNNTKWEPGYVEARHLKIENKGTLAFKYKLLITPNGAVEELADVIDVYFVEGATQVNRNSFAGVAPVGTLRDLINDVDGAAHGALAMTTPGDTSTARLEEVKRLAETNSGARVIR
jgi:predicted ribosomally synthesized peptide with SipW-like signal peptide